MIWRELLTPPVCLSWSSSKRKDGPNSFLNTMKVWRSLLEFIATKGLSSSEDQDLTYFSTSKVFYLLIHLHLWKNTHMNLVCEFVWCHLKLLHYRWQKKGNQGKLSEQISPHDFLSTLWSQPCRPVTINGAWLSALGNDADYHFC